MKPPPAAGGGGAPDGNSLERTPTGAGGQTGRSGDRPGGDFFDLRPEEVAGFEPRGEVVARRRPLEVKPLLKTAVAILVLAGLVAGAVLAWPSSRARVPDVVGKTLDNAMRTARESGMDPAVVAWRYSSGHSDGVVLGQSPAGGSVVGKGSRLNLTVCKGPGPEAGAGGAPSRAKAGDRPGGERVITIDAGHQVSPVYGEWADPGMTRRTPGDQGGRGTTSGNHEHAVTIDIAMKLKGLLEKEGLTVRMTRETNTVDLANTARAEMANDAGSLLCVHIHCGNSADPMAKGIRTLCPAQNAWTAGFHEKSKTAALYIQEQLVISCELDDLGVLADGDLPEFNWSKVPTAEPEIGFLTNPRDDAFLAEDQFRWKAAWGLRNGIKKFLDNT